MNVLILLRNPAGKVVKRIVGTEDQGLAYLRKAIINTGVRREETSADLMAIGAMQQIQHDNKVVTIEAKGGSASFMRTQLEIPKEQTV